MELGYLKKLGPVRRGLKKLIPDTVIERNRYSGEELKSVFITGIHRSGTSWIGKIISQACKVMYWREPYNPDTVNTMPQQYFFIPKGRKSQFYKSFTDNLFKGRFAGSVFDYSEPRQWFNGIHHRHVIKDPTAAFLLEWLTSMYILDAVIVLRHPAGFVSSLLKLGWDFDFNLFLSQKELMENYLDPYKNVIKQYNYKGINIEKASVLWGLVYYVLFQMSKGEDFIWTRYEDLCINPLHEFRKLFNAIELDWDSNVEKKLIESINDKATFKDNITSDHNRNTKEMAMVWKKRLSKNEINTVLKITEQFGLEFYNNF